MEKNSLQNRIIILWCIFIVWLIIISFKLFYVQVINQRFLSERARSQRETEVLTIESRGDIVSRNNWILATSETKNSFFIDPQEITTEYFDSVSDKFPTDINGLNINALKKDFRLAQSNVKRFMWLARRISNQDADKINALNLPWIKSQKEYIRVYPNEYLASNIIGFTIASEDSQKAIENIQKAIENDRKAIENTQNEIEKAQKGIEVGVTGIEKSFEEHLKYRKVRSIYTRDRLGRIYNVDEIGESKKTIVTTLDEVIQTQAEILLEDSVKKTNAKQGTLIVLGVNNGEILALANYPSFDPNKFNEFSPGLYRNLAVDFAFEPGIAFEPFAKAALLEMTGDKILPENNEKCAGIDTKNYFEQLQKLGIGALTGIDLPAEKPGFLMYERWHIKTPCKILERGLEIAVTPLQIASSTAMLANDGVWVQPHIVMKINNESGEIIYQPNPVTRRLMKRTTGREIKKFLQEKKSLNGKFSKDIFVGIQGNTPKVNPATREYEPLRQVITVTGFVPASKPKFAVTLIIDEPHQNINIANYLVIEDYNRIIKAVLGEYSLL